MLLLLQRIRFGIGPAVDDDFGASTSVACPLPPEAFTSPSNRDAAAGGEVLHFGFVVGERAVGDDLQVGQRGAVVELEEAEAALGIAAGANPTPDADLFPTAAA